MLDMVQMNCFQLCAKTHGVIDKTILSPTKQPIHFTASSANGPGKALKHNRKENEANIEEDYYNLDLPQDPF